MDRWIRWLGLGVVASLALIGATTSAQSSFTPLTVACGDDGQAPDLIPEVRRAAGLAAGIQLDRDVQAEFRRLIDLFFASEEDLESESVEPISRADLEDFDQALTERIRELEWIARGPNAACRQAVEFSALENNALYNLLDAGLDVQPTSTLASLYVTQAFVRAYLATDLGEVTADDLQNAFPAEAFLDEAQRITDSALRASTFELALARSILTRIQLLFLAGETFSETFLVEELLDAEKWRTVACGGTETFSELDWELDGSVSFTHIDGGGNPFRETAAQSWFFALFIRNPFAVIFDPTFLENLRQTAVNGCSPELREAAAEFFFQLVDEGGRLQMATEVIRSETSPEFQKAAAPWAALAWVEDDGLTGPALQQRAFHGETAGVRQAAGWALGLLWAKRVQQDELTRSTIIEFLGPDGESMRTGTLIQFAAIHTETQPALADAAVLPLTLMYLDEAQ